MFFSSSTPGYWAQVPYKPQDSDVCIQCKHTFAKHFEQYDGLKSGCNERKKEACACDGFAMRYRVRWEWKVTPYIWHTNPASTYNNFGDVWPTLTTGNAFYSSNVNVSYSGDAASIESTMNAVADALKGAQPVKFKEGEIIKYRSQKA